MNEGRDEEGDGRGGRASWHEQDVEAGGTSASFRPSPPPLSPPNVAQVEDQSEKEGTGGVAGVTESSAGVVASRTIYQGAGTCNGSTPSEVSVATRSPEESIQTESSAVSRVVPSDTEQEQV